MGKKDKKKGKGKPSDDSSQGGQESQRRQQPGERPRREPQQVYQVPHRRGQQPSAQEEPVRREPQPSPQEEPVRREPELSPREEPVRREPQPSPQEETFRKEPQSSRQEEPYRKGPQTRYQEPQKEQQPVAAKGFGRGRGRGKHDPHSQAVPRVGAETATFFQKEAPAKVEDIYPDSPASTTARSEPVKDASCRSKFAPKPENVESLSKFAGISLESKSPVKFKLAKRPNYGILGEHIGLYVNYFRLQFKNTSIYHYDIDISEATKDKKMGESLMSQGRTAKEDILKKVKHVERQKRRNIGKTKCRQIISEMIKSKSLQQFSPVYDGQKNLFTGKPLPYKEKLSFPIDVLVEGKVKQYYVTIQPVVKQDGSNCIDLQPLVDLYKKRSTEIPLEVLLVYETVMNHRDPPFDQVQFRNSFFSLKRENVTPLGSGLEIWFGYNQSIHLTEQGPVVVINLAAKAFHKAGPVIDYASDILGRDITRLPRFENWQFNSLTNALKGLSVKVTHQKHPRKYKIKGLTKLSTKEVMFDEGNRKISVFQYFQEKYNYKLSYPHLPCLQMQTSNNTTFIPIETCVVVEGQPKIGKLSGELTSKMIKSTAIPPESRFKSIRKDAVKVHDISKKYMDAFGLIMNVDLLKVNGRVIVAPQLLYKDKKISRPDNRGVWRIEDKKQFYREVKIRSWVLISFADTRFFGHNVLSNYCQFLVQSANKCGMQMDRPMSINIIERNVSTERAISDAKKSGVDFAIVVLNRKDNKHTYDEVKFLSDFKYGLVTQCMEDKTLSRINDQITTNVCLKINVKLGGINHILMHRPQVFSTPVMVIGADAIHWTRGLGFPSIVSVVGSLDPFASRYALTCHAQRNDRKGKISQEIIKNMKEISLELLEAFRLNTGGKYPQKIIVFRDGVSEGQFQHAVDYEVSGIQQAFQQMAIPIVPITFIVVQKKHQTRFYPQNPGQSVGKCKNIPPGTVVDKDISHPVYFDFFVCSHEGIQGTSKPAHYTVLHDDNNFKADELQQLCHFLCHTYVRCTRSVSLPAPVLYADLAAFRAKKYADLFINPDDASTSSFGEDIERDFPPDVNNAIKSMKTFEKNMFYV